MKEEEEERKAGTQKPPTNTNLDDDEPGVIVHAEARLHEATAACKRVLESGGGEEKEGQKERER